MLDEPTRELCAAVAAGRLAPARLAVVAPGGYGKTALLEHLAGECARAGIPVARFAEPAAPTDAELVLVDDAHALGEDDLAELLRLAADDRAGLVIAARPWPRPVALGDVLARLRAQIVLRPLDRAQTGAVLGHEPGRLTDFVHAETGGVPGFVVRLARALDARPRPEVPAAALAEFRTEFHRLEPDALRLLVAADSGAGLDVHLLGELLGRGQDDVGEMIEAARAAGLLSHDGTLLPLAARALRNLVPADRRQAVHRRLVRLRLDRGGPVLPLVRPLLDSGVAAGTDTAAAFEAAAGEAAPADPALAARLYGAAVAAGTPAITVGARWAEVAARAGDLDTALRLADEVVASADAPDRADGARVSGTALAHRGQLARSAELHRWSGSTLSTVYAALGLLGTGRPDEARRLLDEPSGGEPPTLLAGAMSATARALLESISGAPTAALSTLVSSAEMLEPVGRSVLLPDSPAALGAVVGIHCGELGIAEPLLERAVAAECGDTALAARHRLLLAWVAMVRGNTELATERLRAAGEELPPRDWLFAVGLRAGLARRSSDLAALRLVWGEACEAVIRHPVDLFTLLPFGELAVAAARLGDRDRLAHHLRRAWDLLHTLGDPPLWTTPLHWSCLHAAIIGERQEEAREHASALAAGAGHGAYFAAVAEAAECWLDVIGGAVDPGRAEAAARGLHGAGLWWDGARLAGQAAIRTTDRKAMVALLDCARMLQGRAGTDAAGDAAAEPGGTARLSEREYQVAELVVAGLTYRQVGDRLYISAKTVEHHMARMRQRLGATSRGDLLAQLRALLTARE